MSTLVDKILELHGKLLAEHLPYAFGGALALAWCTQQARGTIDIDLNVFLAQERARQVLEALPNGCTWAEADVDRLLEDGQVRVWWDRTPIDLFLNSTPYHDQLLARVAHEQFAGHSLPFLSCLDLAVFKAFFNRTKDWADLEAMRDAGTLPVNEVRQLLEEYLGTDDERTVHLARLEGVGPS